MSQSNYLQPLTSSTPLQSTLDADSAFDSNLSCWTPGKKSVDISESDRQILEFHAERLVDEVFASEIEPILLEPTFLVSVSPHPSPRQSSSPPSRQQDGRLMLPPAISAESEPAEFQTYFSQSFEAEIDALDYSTRLLPEKLDAAEEQLQQLQNQGWQDRVLLGAGLGALFLAIIGGFATQNHWQPLAFLKPTAVVPTGILSHRDPFLDYLRASLHRLDQDKTHPAQTNVMPGERTSLAIAPTLELASQPGTPLPVIRPAHQSPATQTAKTPVVVKPITSKSSGVSVAPIPATVSLSQIPIATLPPPPPLQDPSFPSAPNFVEPSTTKSSSQSVPQQPIKSTKSPAADSGNNPTNSDGSNSTVIPLASPSPIGSAIKTVAPRQSRVPRTLVGVLEMGEQSLALIEVSGVTRRVRVGEAIGGDESILMRVGDQEAILQRGQEKLNIQVGQRF